MSESRPESATLHHLDAVALADSTRHGKHRATTVLEHFLDRIQRLNNQLGAFVFVDAERARKQAGELDERIAAGDDPGPLAGVPLGVKELQPLKDWPLTWASVPFANNVARSTATMLRSATSAGAIPIGLTASPEFGRASFTASAFAWNLSQPMES